MSHDGYKYLWIVAAGQHSVRFILYDRNWLIGSPFYVFLKLVFGTDLHACGDTSLMDSCFYEQVKLILLRWREFYIVENQITRRF